jgi:NAD-dependent deacetylase
MSVVFSTELSSRLARARQVTVLTGAGVSAESGIPTFRNAQTGLWAQYDPTELATPQAFLRTPKLVWEWYDYRRKMVEAATPNAGHYALVDMEQHFADFLLITQNIDNLHWRAGSRDLLELHGNISRVRCFECAVQAPGWDDDGEIPPRCGHCGGMLRPDVVWFGEGLSSQGLRAAYQAAERAEVFFSVGTSAMVQPAAALPLIARRAGAYLVEINPEETSLALMADEWLCGPAGEILPMLVQHLSESRPANPASEEEL